MLRFVTTFFIAAGWLVGQGGLFRPASTIPSQPVSGEWPVAVADVDGDGDADVIADSTFGGLQSRLTVFLGDGAGGLSAGIDSLWSSPAWASLGVAEPGRIVGIADVTQDGLPDLMTTADVCCQPFPNVPIGFRLHLNNGNGTFATTPIRPTTGSANVRTTGIVDLDADGVVEYYSTESQPTGPAIRIAWIDPVTLTDSIIGFWPLPAPTWLATHGDFNGDGLVDIAYGAGTTVTDIRVLVQGPGLTFTDTGPFPVAAIEDVAIAYDAEMLARDIDGDGDDDLVVTGHITIGVGPLTHHLSVLRGQPAATLSAATLLTGLPTGHLRRTLTDFDLDGLAEMTLDTGIVRVTPPFHASLRHEVPVTQNGLPIKVVGVGDMDGDGDPDAVVRAVQNIGGAVSWHVGVALNDAVHAPGCGPTSIHQAGTAQPGNPAMPFSLGGLQPGAMAAVGVSLARASVPVGSCQIAIDVSPTLLLSPSPTLGVFIADAAGRAGSSIPVPMSAAGVVLHTQWLFADAAGPLPWLGGSALSDARMIVAW